MEIHSLDQLLSGKFTHVTHIKISAELTSFPNEIVAYADTLEILDLSNNQLSTLPDNFSDLKKLKIAFFSDNLFTQFPAILGNCPNLTMIGFKANKIKHIPINAFPVNLQWLILTNNNITQIPASIGECKYLQKVALAGNNLKMLPIEMANCKNLELLRLSANQILELPQWLLLMPKLAWLAYSGNPCTYKNTNVKPLPLISFNDIVIMEQLGEGASGIISKAKINKGIFGIEEKYVAIKVFKGEVTSDGYPEDEMNISSQISAHPNLVTVIGKIKEHPQKKDGLIFELIPPNFKNLGKPPSFKTCTRDTFADNTSFTLAQIIAILKAIAAAAFQLHTTGIMHGDLYAHNTLIDENYHTLFGDFGAATPYDITVTNAKVIERIEVRAFGYMIEDLMTCTILKEEDTLITLKLNKLKNICLLDEPLLRPDFAHITEYLNKAIS